MTVDLAPARGWKGNDACHDDVSVDMALKIYRALPSGLFPPLTDWDSNAQATLDLSLDLQMSSWR